MTVKQVDADRGVVRFYLDFYEPPVRIDVPGAAA
jgi:hypothetical protein